MSTFGKIKFATVRKRKSNIILFYKRKGCEAVRKTVRKAVLEAVREAVRKAVRETVRKAVRKVIREAVRKRKINQIYLKLKKYFILSFQFNAQK